MGYLKEFEKEIAARNLSKFMFLWEEYCTSDLAPKEELKALLEAVRDSDFKPRMKEMVETILPLVFTLQDPDAIYECLIPLYDIQDTNTDELYELALSHAERRFSSHPHYQDILRLVGLRPRKNFQGALSAMELLAHLKEGKFVYHNGGWDTGEVMELSFLKEMAVFEFESTQGARSITLKNAMRSMNPLSDEHFLARRFGNPDALEAEARKDPVKVVKLLLKDLGPKTAAEIKDELAELVIPEADWTKWWQLARSKLKRDLSVETPSTLRNPFYLRDETLSHEEEFSKQIQAKRKPADILAVCHAFSKEHASELKEEAVKAVFLKTLHELEKEGHLPRAHLIEMAFMKKILFGASSEEEIKKLIEESDNLIFDIDGMEILQYKKMALAWIRTNREDWKDLFLAFLDVMQNALLRDFLVKELSCENEALDFYIKKLVAHPSKNPDLFFWFFTKHVIQQKGENFGPEMVEPWWEAFLLLLSKVENQSGYSDLVKKMGLVITANRYKEVRELFKESSFEFTKEFLLLASKCHTLSPHDLKSLKSLAAVRFPTLSAPASQSDDQEGMGVIWASREAYQEVQERIRHIATVETVDNAKEIEAARALGDLRENSEYKYAKERRARLQGEMKRLSAELARARIITEEDVSNNEVGVGSVVEVVDDKGEVKKYTLMGAWDANPEEGILSLQSKLAEAMHGRSSGETFQFKDEKYTIKSLKTIFSE